MEIQYHNKRNMKEVCERLNSLVNVMLGAANTIAGRTLYDAYFMLKKDKGMFRHSLKHYANTAIQRFDNYEKAHITNFGERYRLFLDYLDNIEDQIMPHVDKLYWAMKAVLDKYNVENSALKAKVEIARTMIEYSCCIYDELMRDTKNKTGCDFYQFFLKGRLTGVLNAWDNVTRMLCKTEKDINLNKDENCLLAFRIIEKVLTSEDTLNRAGYIALKQNPKLQILDEKEYKQLQEKYS